MQDSLSVAVFDGAGKVSGWFRERMQQIVPAVSVMGGKAGLNDLGGLDRLDLFLAIPGSLFDQLVQTLPQVRKDFPSALIVVVYPPGQEVRDKDADILISERFFTTEEHVAAVSNNLLHLAAERKESISFSAMLIHDLRSPVQSIIGYLELLEQEVFGAINEGQKKILANALNQGETVSALLEELALVFQLESRQYQLTKMPMRPGQIIQEALRALWVLADQKNIKLVPQLPNDLPVLKADSLSVSRVLNNLVNNAIKFTPVDGTIRVTVRKTLSAGKQPMLEFCIIDSGPGIPPQEIEHIFDKYYRLQNDAQLKNGQGLGLYICRLLVEAHGGKVGAYNNREGGSTFYFTLPVEEGNGKQKTHN